MVLNQTTEDYRRGLYLRAVHMMRWGLRGKNDGATMQLCGVCVCIHQEGSAVANPWLSVSSEERGMSREKIKMAPTRSQCVLNHSKYKSGRDSAINFHHLKFHLIWIDSLHKN